MTERPVVPPVAPEIRRARLATFAFFILNGFILGMWLVHIPVVKDRVGADTTQLGWLLLTMGIGAFVGMQVGGRAADRFGAGRVALVCAAASSVAVIGLGLVHSIGALAVALVVYGFSNGLIDLSMNAHAVEVERHYHRPIMAAFHAYWSVGGLAAAILGGTMIRLGVPLEATLVGTAIIGLLVVLACRPAVLPRPAPTRTPEPTADAAPPGPRWSTRIIGLGVLAFVLMLSEGVANDWGSVDLDITHGTSKATAAWAYAVFTAAMTLGRLVTDRIVHRIGPSAFVRAGACTAGTGLAIAALAPTPVVALVGWAVTGLGLSGCVPQFFTAAGNVDQDASGTNLARVAGMGYTGLLAGPAIIGGLTHWVDLPTTFWLPAVGCIVAGIVAPRLLRSPRPDVRPA